MGGAGYRGEVNTRNVDMVHRVEIRERKPDKRIQFGLIKGPTVLLKAPQSY